MRPGRRASPRATVALVLLVAVVAISFAAPFFRQANPTHPLTKAAIRLAIASVLLWPIALRSWARVDAAQKRRAAGAGVLYGLHFGAWVWSLELTSVAASVTLVTSTPLLLALVSLATGRDRPQRRHGVAVALATVGVALVSGTDWQASPAALAGDGLALLGAAAMAAYFIVGRQLGARLDVWVYSALATSVGAATLFATALLAGVSPLPSSPEALAWLALAAVVSQLIGHMGLTWALRHTKPTVVAMATAGEPVGATLLAWAWLGETVAPLVAIGCVVTIAAVLLAVTAPNPLDSAAAADGGEGIPPA